MMYKYKTMASPVGALKLVASDKGLAAVLWENDDPKRVRLAPLVEDADHPLLQDAERQIDEYFSGKRRTFSLPLDFAGTDFQKKVWAALVRIPFGETKSYGEVAREIGSAGAMRAVGSAANKNPISIVAPCHRVVGASGKLTGFAGGLAAKVRLLAVEGRLYGADATRDSLEISARRQERRAGATAPSLFDEL